MTLDVLPCPAHVKPARRRFEILELYHGQFQEAVITVIGLDWWMGLLKWTAEPTEIGIHQSASRATGGSTFAYACTVSFLSLSL